MQVRNKGLTPEQIQRAEELQRQYVQRTSGMNIPSPASVIPAVNMSGNMANYEWYKQRGANLPEITTQWVSEQQPIMLWGQHTVMTEQMDIEGMPSAGSIRQDNPEDLVVPPSLEEMGVNIEKPVKYVALDDYISAATEEAENNQPQAPQPNAVANWQIKTLAEETKKLTETNFYKMTIKELREMYHTLGGMKDVSKANNKNYLVNLILKLKFDGSQSKEE